MNKDVIRSLIKQKKSELNKEYIESESDKIIDKLLAHKSYMNSKIIFTYVSFNQEVRTNRLIQQGLKDNKRIAVPKIVDNQLEFIWIDNYSSYETSNIGISEPIEEKIVTKEELENLLIMAGSNQEILMIVPGLAFDKNKNRIGYGKGYYDTYFLRNELIPFRKIAITYDFQIMENIETWENDIRMDEIISVSYHIV